MTTDSTWIRGLNYQPLGKGLGVLQIETTRGDVLEYSRVPSWLKGLMLAGDSIGRAYNRLVKDRYPYRRLRKGAEMGEDELTAALRASLGGDK